MLLKGDRDVCSADNEPDLNVAQLGSLGEVCRSDALIPSTTTHLACRLARLGSEPRRSEVRQGRSGFGAIELLSRVEPSAYCCPTAAVQWRGNPGSSGKPPLARRFRYSFY
jgi:hypothetical protein